MYPENNVKLRRVLTAFVAVSLVACGGGDGSVGADSLTPSQHFEYTGRSLCRVQCSADLPGNSPSDQLTETLAMLDPTVPDAPGGNPSADLMATISSQ